MTESEYIEKYARISDEELFDLPETEFNELCEYEDMLEKEAKKNEWLAKNEPPKGEKAFLATVNIVDGEDYLEKLASYYDWVSVWWKNAGVMQRANVAKKAADGYREQLRQRIIRYPEAHKRHMKRIEFTAFMSGTPGDQWHGEEYTPSWMVNLIS